MTTLQALCMHFCSECHLLLSVVSKAESFPLCELHEEASRPRRPSHSRSAESFPLDALPPSVSSRLVRRGVLVSLFPLDGFCSPLDSELPLSMGELASRPTSSSSSAPAGPPMALLLTVASELALLIIVKGWLGVLCHSISLYQEENGINGAEH